jgi:hypothetical protein
VTPAALVLLGALADAPSTVAASPGQDMAPSRSVEIALGFGASIDTREPAENAKTAVQTLFSSVGYGGASWLVEGVVYATSREAKNNSPERLGGTIAGGYRPGTLLCAGPGSYGCRIIRSFTVTFGPGYELSQKLTESGARFGLRAGAHIDFPLQPPGGAQAAVRLSASRMFGFGHPTVSSHRVEDSVLEAAGSFAISF